VVFGCWVLVVGFVGVVGGVILVYAEVWGSLGGEGGWGRRETCCVCVGGFWLVVGRCVWLSSCHRCDGCVGVCVFVWEGGVN